MTDDAGARLRRGGPAREPGRARARAAVRPTPTGTSAPISAAEAAALYDDAMGDDGPMVAVAGPARRAPAPGQDDVRPSGGCRPDGSSSTSGRTRWATGWETAKLLDLDDYVGVTGTLFRTRTGEVTVRGPGGRAAGQEPPAAAPGKDPADRGGRRDLRRARRSRGALPPALRRSRGPSRRAPGLRDPRRGDPVPPALPRRARLPRGGDAGPPAALRRRDRRGRSSTHHNALDMPLYLRDRGRAVPQAADRRRVRAGLRDRARLPERGDGPDPQSGIHHAGVLPGLRRLPRHHGADRGHGRRGGAALHRRARRHGARAGRSTSPRRCRRVAFVARHRGAAPASTSAPPPTPSCVPSWSRRASPARRPTSYAGGKLVDELFKAFVEPHADPADLRGGLSEGALAAGAGAPRRSRR